MKSVHKKKRRGALKNLVPQLLAFSLQGCPECTIFKEQRTKLLAKLVSAGVNIGGSKDAKPRATGSAADGRDDGRDVTGCDDGRDDGRDGWA